MPVSFGQQIAEAYVKIRPDTTGFRSDVAGGVGDALADVKRTAASIAGGAIAISLFRGGLDELKSQQAVLAQTESVIRSTGGVAGVTADHVSDLAGSLQEVSGKDAELIQSGENLLLTFRGIRNEVGAGNDIFDRATTASLDLSVAFRQDMTQSAVLVGKALEDPIAGLTALRRVGVTFTDGQEKQIKALVANGHAMQAQKLILAELEAQVGGSAKAYGETLPGKLERAGNALDDLKGTIVGTAAPAIEEISSRVTTAVGVFTALPQPIQDTVIRMAAAAAISKPLGIGLDAIKSGVTGLKTQFSEAGSGMAGFTSVGGKLAKGGVISLGIASITASIQKLQETQNQGTTDFEKTLPDPSDIDGYIAAVNAGIAETDKLSDSIASMGATGATGLDGLKEAGTVLGTAGKFFANAVTGGRAFEDSIEQQTAKLDGMKAALEPAIARATEMGNRVALLAGDLGVSGTAVKDFVGQFKGLDITQVPLDKLQNAYRALVIEGQDVATVAQYLGVSVKTAGDDAADAAAKYKKLSDSFFGLQDAQHGVADSNQRILDAQEQLATAGTRVASAQHAAAEAARRVTDAERAQAEQADKVAAAVDGVRAARDALRAAEAGPNADDLLTARENTLRITEAEKALADLRKQHIPARDRALARDRAQLAVDQAHAAQAKTQAEIEGRVETAKKDLRTAEQKLADEQRASVGAAQAVTDAHYAQEQAAQAVTQASKDVTKATRDVGQAQYDSIAAVEELTGKQVDFGLALLGDVAGAGQLLEHLKGLQKQYPQTAAAIQPLIDQLRAAAFPPPITQANSAQEIIKFLTGGSSPTEDDAKARISKLAHQIPGYTGTSYAQDLDALHIPKLHSGGTYRAPTPGGEGFALLQDGEHVTAAGGARGSVVFAPITQNFHGMDPATAMDLAGRRIGRALTSLAAGGF